MDEARKLIEAEIAKVDWTQTRSATLRFARGAVPFSIPIESSLVQRGRFTAERLAEIAAEGRERVVVEPGPSAAPPGSTGDPGDADEEPIQADAPVAPRPGSRAGTEMPCVEGVASSTSRDFYGTDMSIGALNSMARQFKRGIPYLPRHNYGLFGASIEWDEVIGRTIDAVVEPMDGVAAPVDEREPQAVLRVTSALYPDEPKALSLLRRVERQEPIGQSIGGWFVELAVSTDEEGEVIRVQVLDVELDHLAVTRAPANPDSNDLASLVSARSIGGMVRSALSERRKVTTTENEDGTTTQHVEGDRKTAPAMAACARAERSDDRIVVSFEAGASDEAIRDALRLARAGDLGPEVARVLTLAAEPAAIDNNLSATYASDVQAPSGDDARRSALPAQPTPLGADPGASPPETPMPELSPDVLRRIVADAIAPLSQRLDAIERSGRPVPTSTPAPAAAAPDAIDWEARAKAAERTLSTIGERTGRPVPTHLPVGPQARTVYDGLVERTRTEAPTLAAAAARALPILVDEDGGDTKATRSELEAGLAAMINAAEIDGVITNPYARSIAAWR